MWARATRVEFIIVSVALLVLLLCSNAPRSGNADVGEFSGPDRSPSCPSKRMPLEPGPIDADTDMDDVPGPPKNDENEPNDGVSEASFSGNTAEPPLERQPIPRVATVDARNCDRLDYQDVMYGKVTVRWVWNGTKFVPQKVCVVEEGTGVSSVWSFDQQENAVLTEVVEKPNSPR